MPGIVYLVQPTDCINTNCYKIGMSTSNTIKRIKSYGHQCVNIVSRECNNPIELERELIKAFQLKFGNPTRGKEWFSGNKIDMINTYDECFRKHGIHVDAVIIDKQLNFDCLKLFVQNHIKFVQNHPKVVSTKTNKFMYQDIYELFDILPSNWFNKREYVILLSHALRNKTVPDRACLNSTLKRLIKQRSDRYYKGLLVYCFTSRLDYRQRQCGIPSLTKMIKEYYPDQYEEWFNKWKAKKVPARKMKMTYKKGGLIKLSDLKASYSGTLTAAILLQMDSRFTISPKDICKSCKTRHIKGCCNNYDRGNRSTTQFVNNVVLV